MAKQYLLCGTDEDGCNAKNPNSCLCMPYDGDAVANAPYCLDLSNVSCHPLASTPNCNQDNIYPNQATCLATAFQSEPNPPCSKTSESFCIHHKIARCTQDGGQASCTII